MVGGKANLMYSPGPGLWCLVLGPFGPDLGPDLDLTWDLYLDLSLTITIFSFVEKEYLCAFFLSYGFKLFWCVIERDIMLS